MNAPDNGSPRILIVGAGPTGLVLALWLTRLGVPVRIIDKLAGPETTSRAIGVQARTLEFYQQLGFADRFIEHGRKAPATNMWICGRNRARLAYQSMGGEISPFPFALVLPQDEHEKSLTDELLKLGVKVERQAELAGFTEKNGGVEISLKRADGMTETCAVDYIAGCDGARSTVRETLKINFEGATYEQRFYVADVQTGWSAMNGEMHLALDEQDFLAVFPLKEEGRARLIGTLLNNGTAADSDHAAWEDVNKSVINGLGMPIDRVNWFSVYRVHHRVADHFRKGRAFLLGDAAHIHTPVGGQGMNTGIGDAINLAWKLAGVLHGKADASILDSYEAERIGFARHLVEATDRVFAGVVSPRSFDKRLRLNIVPIIFPLMFKVPSVRHYVFRTLSQVALNYRSSPLSQGRAGDIHGGDRLPWLNGTTDNFAKLRSLGWQVHVYGDATAAVQNVCTTQNLPLHVFPWQLAMNQSGFGRNAAYLVRPDGHVALAVAQDRSELIARFLDERQLTA